MNETIAIDWFALAMPAVSALACLSAASALTGLIRINKGAKINRAWGFLAFGFVCFSLASFDRAFQLLDLPNASSVRDPLTALGAVCLMIGAVYGRSLHKGLLK